MTTTTELETLARDPQAFDTALAALHARHGKIEARIAHTESEAHHRAGDKRHLVGRTRVWELSLAACLALVPELDAARDKLFAELAEVQAEIRAMDGAYTGWSRFYPTETSGGGHIHATTSCHTLYVSTVITWRPELSGRAVEEAVATLGPVLCQVCFPEAKAEFKREPREVARERNAAAKAEEQAARAAKAAAKTLTEDETGRFRHADRVTTVAAAKQVIRDAVDAHAEALWYASPAGAKGWQDPDGLARVREHAVRRSLELDEDAATAALILMARERATAGHGASREDIAKIRANAGRKAKTDWPA